jgi:hypothetical protein
MKRRKNRLVIEFTTSHPLTEKDAAKGLQLLLDRRLDTQAAPIWANALNIYADKIVVKSFSRVMAAEARK